jgi:hypothetical protein
LNKDDEPEGLSREWIEAHNARVYAFWAEYEPKIKAITREQAEQIIDLGLTQYKGMNRIAIEMRGKLDFDIPEGREVAIGSALYKQALEMLDLYDPEFRPKPERVFMMTIRGAEVFFLPHAYQYEVTLNGVTRNFKPNWNPTHGMDINDVQQADEIAQELGGTEDETST